MEVVMTMHALICNIIPFKIWQTFPHQIFINLMKTAKFLLLVLSRLQIVSKQEVFGQWMESSSAVFTNHINLIAANMNCQRTLILVVTA